MTTTTMMMIIIMMIMMMTVVMTKENIDGIVMTMVGQLHDNVLTVSETVATVAIAAHAYTYLLNVWCSSELVWRFDLS